MREPEILDPALMALPDDPDPASFPDPPTDAPAPSVEPSANGHGKGKGKKGGRILKATNQPSADLITRAVAYMLENTPAIQGTKGSNRTMWAARCVVYGFDLGQEIGFDLLKKHHNPTCVPEWTDKELRHKCEDADVKPFGKPRGWLRDAMMKGTATSNGVPPKGAPGSAERPLLIYRLPELLAAEFPPPKWAVPGLLSEGLTILAGKPKLGKSWLALNLGLTIAAGGMALGTTKVVAGDVLYLSLEDRWRRIQDRARKVLAGLAIEASTRLHVAVEWPRQDQGGLEAIEKWAKSVENPTLIVVDVWAKFRPVVKNGNRSAYEQDYEQVGELKQVTDENKLSAFLLHHCKKAKADDALEEVSGTNGIAGCADGVLVLTRARNENEAELFMTGRDIEEAQLALEFDPKTFTWKSLGKSNERTESKFKQLAIDLFKANTGQILGVTELADKLQVPIERRGYFRNVIYRMEQEGIIERTSNGRYRYPIVIPNGVEIPGERAH